MRLWVFPFGLLLGALAQPSAAQNGRFMGVVTRDTLGHPIASAQVALPSLNRGMQTNARGEFQFSDVPPGRYEVDIRAIGFESFTATIDIAPGQTINGDLTLTPSVISLDTVRSTVANVVRGREIELREFDSRKKSHASGATFFDDSLLRRRDNDQLVSLLGHMPGARVIIGGALNGRDPGATPGQGTYLASALNVTDGKPEFFASTLPCYVTVYRDGINVFQNNDGSGRYPPDFSLEKVSDYSGIEYYPTPAMAPAQYSQTGNSCGVLLLWSRRQP